MKKRACLILGCCLVLQAVAARPVRGLDFTTTEESEGKTPARGIASVPLYHDRQERELLGKSSLFASQNQVARANRNLDLALFVYSRVHDLLPESYKDEAGDVAQTLIETANRYEMDPMLLMALIKHESRFNPEVIGAHGEIGLMQIKPSTARWLLEQGDVIGHDGTNLKEALKDPVVNIAFGSAYLARLRHAFKGRGTLYLAAYNMGAYNLKSRLRDGLRPRLYSDRILTEYVAFNLDFAHPDRRVASVASMPGRTLGL